MNSWLGATLTCVVLCVSVDARAVQLPPVPENPLQAQTALGFNPKTRCPDLRITDGGTKAVVVFWLPSSGIPSHIAIKSSSGSDALDSATISCVASLRFAAATTLGDGNPIDSWQQIALSWANRTEDSHRQPGDVTVRACIDEAGKLEQAPTIVHSSGMASLDQAALKIAESGAAYYRPDTSPNVPPVTGCAQLAIKFEAK